MTKNKFEKENERRINEHIRRQLEKFQKEDLIEFSRLYCENLLIAPITAEVRITNQYEREWKIKTNMNKFSAVPVFRRKTHELIIERRRIGYQEKARIQGFKFRRSVYLRGIEDLARRTSMYATKLKFK